MADDGYAGRAGVIAGSRWTVLAVRLSAHRPRQRALRVTPRRQGHSANMMCFILSGLLSTSLRRRMRQSRAKKCAGRASACQRRLTLVVDACSSTTSPKRTSSVSETSLGAKSPISCSARVGALVVGHQSIRAVPSRLTWAGTRWSKNSGEPVSSVAMRATSMSRSSGRARPSRAPLVVLETATLVERRLAARTRSRDARSASPPRSPVDGRVHSRSRGSSRPRTVRIDNVASDALCLVYVREHDHRPAEAASRHPGRDRTVVV